MKKIINNALNEVNDKYIEEAHNATHLQHNTAKTIRNIAVPVASAAAIAGLCLGLAKLDVFRSGGVDLLPADTTSGAGNTSSITINDPDYQYGFNGYTPILPDRIPLALQTSEHIQSIIFGSEFPEMIYADEDTAMFTDGISGLYIYDMEEETLTFAADIYATFDLALTDFPEKIGPNYGGDSWSGIELFAGADGTPYCSMAYHSNIVLTGSGLPSQNQWETKYYEIDTETLTLSALPMDNMTIPLYEGLKEIPYSKYEDYRNISLNAAYIDDTDEFVYIRNCTADIDLLPEYSMRQIELRRWTAEEVTGDATDGGYFPFDQKTGKNIKLYSYYYTGDSVVGHDCHGINFNGVKFMLDMYASTGRVPEGYYTLYGDIVCLTEENNGYQWLYRIENDTLQPLEALIAQPTDADLEQTYHGKALIRQTDVPADEILSHHHYVLKREIEAITAALNEEAVNIEDKKADLQMRQAAIQAILDGDRELTEKERLEYNEELTNITMFIAYLEADREELELQLQKYEEELAAVETQMQKAGYFTYDVQEFLSSLDPRVATAVKEYIPVVPDDMFWGTSSAEIPDDIVTAHAIRMLDKSISVMDNGEAQTLLNDAQLVYYMCLNSYWDIEDTDDTVASDYAYQIDEMNNILNDLILSRELSYSDSADMENMLYPLEEKYNYITTYFGNDDFRGGTHYGIDIAGADIGGADIFAVQDGLVIATNKDGGWSNGLGNYVLIDHGNGYCTLYAHCHEVYTDTGDKVKRGDTIAAVGATGLSTGNHLHFEIRKDGVAVDPLGFPYGNVHLLTYDGFEVALQYALGNTGEAVFPDSIAMPISSDGNTVNVYEHDGYTEYRSYVNADTLAADKGEIVFAGYTGDTDECCIIILHEGYVTVYRGLSNYTSEDGEQVARGQSIGIAGDDGAIRFELYTDSTDYDPGTCRPVTE